MRRAPSAPLSSTTTTEHRNKRQFQPSITSFFGREDRDIWTDEELDDERGPGPITRAHLHDQHHQHHVHARSSALRAQHQQERENLPGSVQADLLSVGMRVRKSVPEGYKTHKTVSLPSIQTTLSATNTRSPGLSTTITTEYSVKPPRDAVPGEYQHQRELLPFCGLHKIGGFAEQPVTNVHLYGGADASGERQVNIFPLPAEAFKQPFNSQSSTDSAISIESLQPNPTNPSKRSWTDEDTTPLSLSLNSDFAFKLPMKVSEDEVPVSPLSETPRGGMAALRPFAQPKTRRHTAGARLVDFDGAIVKEMDMELDGENAEQEGRVLVGRDSDFEEADFLMTGV